MTKRVELSNVYCNLTRPTNVHAPNWAWEGTDMKLMLRSALFAVACGMLSLTVIGTQNRPRLPKVTRPVLFDTPEADKILAALQVFPPDNPWNQDISALPVHSNSAAIIASIGKDKHIDFNLDMN